ncbi:MAG: MFS transporter [Thermodesulfobacteriota bacterium]
MEGIAESTASLLKVFSGWLSDKIGSRKGLMAAGYAISTLSRPLVALASGWHQVLGSRFMDRFGKGVRTAPRDAIISESADRRFLGRAFGFHRSMDTMGAVVGPALAFFFLGIFSNDYRKVFWLSMVPGILAVLLIVFFIAEKKARAVEHVDRPKLTLRHFDGRFRWFLLVVTIFALGNSSDVFLVLRAQQVGMPPVTIPLVYLFFNLVYSLTSVIAGVAADRFGRKRIIISGFLLFTLVYYGFATVGHTRVIWLLFGLYGLFMGLTEGVQKAFLTTIIPADFKATAFGVYNTAIGLAMFPASLVWGMALGPYLARSHILFRDDDGSGGNGTVSGFHHATRPQPINVNAPMSEGSWTPTRSTVQFFCPNCFHEVGSPHGKCPACGVDMDTWQRRHSYTERLIHALNHPISEVRMGAIISLGHQKAVSAAVPLAQCAMRHAKDIVQGLEIVRSLSKLPNSPERNKALAMLRQHPARAIQEAVFKIATAPD